MTAGRVVLAAVGAVAVAVVAKKRLRRAVDAYRKTVAAGSKPIEGVGTAVAAFVGLVPGGPVNAPP